MKVSEIFSFLKKKALSLVLLVLIYAKVLFWEQCGECWIIEPCCNLPPKLKNVMIFHFFHWAMNLPLFELFLCILCLNLYLKNVQAELILVVYNKWIIAPLDLLFTNGRAIRNPNGKNIEFIEKNFLNYVIRWYQRYFLFSNWSTWKPRAF